MTMSRLGLAAVLWGVSSLSWVFGYVLGRLADLRAPSCVVVDLPENVIRIPRQARKERAS